MVRVATAMIALALAIGCAASVPPATTAGVMIRRGPDLPTAAVRLTSSRGAAPQVQDYATGSVVRVILDPRRDAVVDVWQRYLRGIYDRSLPELAEVFADSVEGTEGRVSSVPRDTLLAALDPRLQSLPQNGSSFAEMLVHGAPVVRSLAEYVGTATPPHGMRPGDYDVTGPDATAAAWMGRPLQLIGPPSEVLVRWVDGRPKIVAVRDAYLLIIR